METIYILTGIVVGFALGIYVNHLLNNKLRQEVALAQKELERANKVFESLPFHTNMSIDEAADLFMQKFESDIAKTCEEISHNDGC